MIFRRLAYALLCFVILLAIGPTFTSAVHGHAAAAKSVTTTIHEADRFITSSGEATSPRPVSADHSHQVTHCGHGGCWNVLSQGWMLVAPTRRATDAHFLSGPVLLHGLVPESDPPVPRAA